MWMAGPEMLAEHTPNMSSAANALQLTILTSASKIKNVIAQLL